MDDDHPRARLYYLFSATNAPRGSSWLARMPAGVFAISLGLFTLLAAWRKAGSVGWHFARQASAVMAWPVAIIGAMLLLLYLYKCKRYPQAVAREFKHPVQCPLQAMVALTVLSAVDYFGRVNQGIWLAIALLALAANAVTATRIVSVMADGLMPENAITPALHLPIVIGASIGAMVLARLEETVWAQLLFGMGVAGWLILEVRALNRQPAGPMPPAVRTTIGIRLAPAPIVTLASAIIWPQLPSDVLLLGLGVAAAFAGAFLIQHRRWRGTSFSLGFWSLAFPLAATAHLIIEAGERGGWPPVVGEAALLVASAVIAWLTIHTLVRLVQRRFPDWH